MRTKPMLLLVSMGIVFAGCYHATVITGLTPSTRVIEKKFASAWIYGLVPPSTVETAPQCPKGVAKLENQLSFVNQLVGFLTIGIYTPMSIVVTCAEKSEIGLNGKEPDITLPGGASRQDIRDAFAIATETAMKTRGPVYIQLP